VREKVADGPLIAKWRKPGYELLCSTLAIQKARFAAAAARRRRGKEGAGSAPRPLPPLPRAVACRSDAAR